MIGCAFHAGCADGFGAASAIFHLFNENDVRYFQCSHNVPNQKLWDFIDANDFDEFYILDFSFSLDQMLRIASKSRILTWIDHHKTAEYLFDKLSSVKNIKIHFSLEESGAYLTWKHLIHAVPTLIQDIGNVDMWRTECTESFTVVNGLFHQMNNFRVSETVSAQSVVANLSDYLKSGSRNELLAIGTVLTDEINSYCQGKLNHAFNLYIGNRTLIAQFSSLHSSELGNLLCKTYGIPACVINPSFDSELGNRFSLSFRSLDSLDSVDSLAVSLGGGGHRNASATKIDWNRLIPMKEGFSIDS